MGTQRHAYSLVVYLCNFILFLFEHDIFALKLLDAFCRWVFDPGDKPSTL